VAASVGYAYTAVAIVLVAGAALAYGQTSESFELSVFGPSLWLLLPAALGAEAHLRLAYTDAVRARAEHAERTREEEARHRVAEERMRIARDLHDVVAHHLALANAQATTVAHLMDRDPGTARAMAGDLGGTISAALRELKATVGLLRQSDDPQAPLEPAPGLGQLPDLAAAFRAAGHAVTVTTDGDPQPLSAGVDLTAFRIIQEALTNVAKHAPASEAHVRIDYAPRLLRLTITNDTGSPRPTAGGTGYGLIGMRERATSLDGRLHAGPRPGGGFDVVAELPLHPDKEPAS
jgi:signal transduction histidine kinase